MTDAEIDALEGRALDSAVARIVLEHCVVRSVSGDTYTESDAAGMPFHPLRAYHADWAAMGLVVAEMKRRGWWITIHSWLPDEAEAIMWPLAKDPRRVHERAATEPVALARAALKAVREGA